jgi:hypothetical protein
VQRFDEDLYWVVYSDGDSEDMEESEVREAVHNYRVHLQPQEEIVAEAASATAGSTSLPTTVDTCGN